MSTLFQGANGRFMKKRVKHIVYQELSKCLSHSTLESLRIRWKNFSTIPPILVYQMGKVGSHAVYSALQQANIPYPLFHVHFLSDTGLKLTENYLRKRSLPVPPHLSIGKALRKRIISDENIRWKIITLVREPIGRDVSDFFENVECYPSYLIDKDGAIKKDELVHYLHNKFVEFDESLSYVCTWFDREIKSVFNIDVYAHPFDVEAGFTIIRHQNIEVLILRLEDLSRNFDDAINTFLRPENPILLSQSNATSEKKHSATYRYVREHLVLPKSTCARVYSSRYVTHFYPQSMKDTFSRKWSKE